MDIGKALVLSAAFVFLTLAGCGAIPTVADTELSQSYNPEQATRQHNCDIEYWGYKYILKPLFHIVSVSADAMISSSLDSDAFAASYCLQQSLLPERAP